MNEKNIFNLISTLVIILFATVIYILVTHPQTKNSDSSGGPESVTISGEIACLPKKGDGPHTLECAVGLKTSDKYYALKNLDKHDPEHTFSATGQKVKVSGSLQKGGDAKHDITGTVSVSSIEESKQ